jgi:hypothetical protein
MYQPCWTGTEAWLVVLVGRPVRIMANLVLDQASGLRNRQTIMTCEATLEFTKLEVTS